MSAVFMVPEFWKLLPDQSIGYNLAYSLKQSWKYWGKPDLDPVLISAYVPDTQPDTDFLC